MSKRDISNYEVGYGKPPKANQFAKGKSGNPRGRRRKSAEPKKESLADIIYEESRRPIAVTVNGKKELLTVQEAVIRSVLAQAIKGNPQACRMGLRMLEIGGKSQSALPWPKPGDVAKVDPHEAAAIYRRFMEQLNREWQ
jgi:hypothetical protein